MEFHDSFGSYIVIVHSELRLAIFLKLRRPADVLAAQLFSIDSIRKCYTHQFSSQLTVFSQAVSREPVSLVIQSGFLSHFLVIPSEFEIETQFIFSPNLSRSFPTVFVIHNKCFIKEREPGVSSINRQRIISLRHRNSMLVSSQISFFLIIFLNRCQDCV